MKKILLIANENSGTGRIRYRLVDIIVAFMSAGYEVQVYPIEPDKGLTSEKVLAGDLSEYEKIVVAGGDGTMSHVIQALMRKQAENPDANGDSRTPEGNNDAGNPAESHDAKTVIPPIGYIPAGSTNDFAKSLGIPTSVSGACRTILEGREFAYDIGCFQNTWFNYVAAFGAFVPVSFQTRQKAKNAFGHGAYILEGVANFQENISFSCPMRVSWDNGVGSGHAEGNFLFGAVYNASSIGGIRIPNASLTHLQDGEMELLLIRKPNTIEDRRLIMASLVGGLQDNSDYIITAHVRQVHFETEREIAWTLDGEDGGNLSRVAVGVAHQAMRILIPERKH